MKKALFSGMVLAVLLFFAAGITQAITIGFEPVSQEVMVGNPVDVDVVISGLGDGEAPSLGTFDLFISYDPTILNLTAVTFGDPVLGDQLDVLFWGINDYDVSTYAPGIEEIFELSYNPADDLVDLQAPSFTLATLTFDTLALGTSLLEIVDPDPPLFASRLGDESGISLTFDSMSGSIDVVPEPATLLLLASGLAGMGCFGRKKFKCYYKVRY